MTGAAGSQPSGTIAGLNVREEMVPGFELLQVTSDWTGGGATTSFYPEISISHVGFSGLNGARRLRS